MCFGQDVDRFSRFIIRGASDDAEKLRYIHGGWRSSVTLELFGWVHLHLLSEWTLKLLICFSHSKPAGDRASRASQCSLKMADTRLPLLFQSHHHHHCRRHEFHLGHLRPCPPVNQVSTCCPPPTRFSGDHTHTRTLCGSIGSTQSS